VLIPGLDARKYRGGGPALSVGGFTIAWQ
jgi:hypothetical protein